MPDRSAAARSRAGAAQLASWSLASEAALIIRRPVSSAASGVNVTATPSGPSTMTIPCSALTSLGSEWDMTGSMGTLLCRRITRAPGDTFLHHGPDCVALSPVGKHLGGGPLSSGNHG